MMYIITQAGSRLILIMILLSCTFEAVASCSQKQFEQIAVLVKTGDGRGHGPDIGSDEWQSVVEFSLGIRGQKDLPVRQTAQWCEAILHSARAQQQMVLDNQAAGFGPAFDCTKISSSSVERLICQDKQLGKLDQQLAGVYAKALDKAADQHPPQLKAEQRGWIKGRNECWKDSELRQCTINAYERRIAELQARYQLVSQNGPLVYHCNANPVDELIVTFYTTQPRSLIAERGDSISWMMVQTSASGSRYQGQNESFWEHAGEATVVWGFEAEPLTCSLVK